MSQFFPNINLIGSITDSKLNTNMQPMRMDGVDTTKKVSFLDTVNDMAKNLNDTVNAPDEVLQDMLTGNENVDIHDVITAINKAELSVTVATQVTTKVVQAYEKIMNIQL